MRLTVIVVLAVLSCAATAAANPIAADIGIDFDPPNYVIETYLPPYVTVNAYVVLYHAQGVGTNWIAFQPSLTPGVGVGTGFTQLVPGPIPIGDWDEGIVVMSSECMEEFPVVLGYLTIFYIGGPGYVLINPHPMHGSVFATCDEPAVQRQYCYVQDGAINTYASELREVCVPTPVQEINWGAIKALYR